MLFKDGGFLKSVKAGPDGNWSDGSALTPRANVFEVGVQEAMFKSPAWTIYHFDPDKPLP
ncbi:hypothetical protein [Pseudomonas fluorescens]|uniref:hypothetical protein n=1 Tax=Pseudomonas TaxID=286 RepID=UPI003D024CF7